MKIHATWTTTEIHSKSAEIEIPKGIFAQGSCAVDEYVIEQIESENVDASHDDTEVIEVVDNLSCEW